MTFATKSSANTIVHRSRLRSAERAGAGPDAEGTREARVLPGVQEDQQDQDHRDDDLGELEQPVHRGLG